MSMTHDIVVTMRPMSSSVDLIIDKLLHFNILLWNLITNIKHFEIRFHVFQSITCYSYITICLLELFGLTDMKILSDRKIFCRSEKKPLLTRGSNFSFLPRVSPLIIFEVWYNNSYLRFCPKGIDQSVFNFIFKLHNFHCFYPFYTFPVSTKPVCEDDYDWLFVYMLANESEVTIIIPNIRSDIYFEVVGLIYIMKSSVLLHFCQSGPTNRRSQLLSSDHQGLE
jgi:hypothetical protein